MMIDPTARHRLAEEIRHFIGCFKDNFAYDDAAFGIETKDRGVIDIRQNIWLIYDDLQRHKMEGEWAPSPEQLGIIKRCLVFLKSSCEYRWPKWPFYYRTVRPLIWLLSFGQLPKRLDRHFNGGGDLEAWPFFTIEEFEEAKAHPVYLAGT